MPSSLALSDVLAMSCGRIDRQSHCALIERMVAPALAGLKSESRQLDCLVRRHLAIVTLDVIIGPAAVIRTSAAPIRSWCSGGSGRADSRWNSSARPTVSFCFSMQPVTSTNCVFRRATAWKRSPETEGTHSTLRQWRICFRWREQRCSRRRDLRLPLGEPDAPTRPPARSTQARFSRRSSWSRWS